MRDMDIILLCKIREAVKDIAGDCYDFSRCGHGTSLQIGRDDIEQGGLIDQRLLECGARRR